MGAELASHLRRGSDRLGSLGASSKDQYAPLAVSLQHVFPQPRDVVNNELQLATF